MRELSCIGITKNREVNYLHKMTIQIRKDIVKMVAEVSSGHVGSSFSLVEIAVVLYYKIMNIDPQNPCWQLRDRFCLSKGHAAPLLYAILASKQYFSRTLLGFYRCIEKDLEGHPASHLTPGVDITSGSLGQGLSQAIGIALAGKNDNLEYRVYCILGDGELQEGQIWEAAMFAGNHCLNNLIAIIDNNKFQNDGPTAEINNCESIEDKFKAFRWNTKVIDGHDLEEIINCFNEINQSRSNKPFAIIANTYKGYGLSIIENSKEAHSWTPDKKDLEAIYKELENNFG